MFFVMILFQFAMLLKFRSWSKISVWEEFLNTELVALIVTVVPKLSEQLLTSF
jgi:hypothetical protein